MKIEITDLNGAMIMAVSGDIDMYSSPLLREELLALVNKKVSPVLIDFKEVSYIDSSGIATFVEGLKGVMAFGGKLKLISLPSGIAEIFNFSRLDKVFEIYGSVDEAINS